MANISVEWPEEFVKSIEELSKKEQVVEKAKKILDGNSEQVRAAIASRCLVDTGQMRDSITATAAKENTWGVYSIVRPVGDDSRGISNATKFAVMEFGANGRAAHPVRQAVVSMFEDKIAKQAEDELFGKL